MSQMANFRRCFPGVGWGIAIFSTYCALEWFADRLTVKKQLHSNESFEGNRYGGVFEPAEPKDHGH
jgi:hypothetical protein